VAVPRDGEKDSRCVATVIRRPVGR
jgi:hypothetical protein